MTLEEFKAECLRDVDRFVRMWEAGSLGDAEMFPREMAPGDWFDQFLSFTTSDKGDEK
jgi:hypothetical protein